MLILIILLSLAGAIVATGFSARYMRVHNRPGYFRALAFALLFAARMVRGKVDFKHSQQSLIWDAWPGSSLIFPFDLFGAFTLLYLAMAGKQFRMDQTDYLTSMEVWSSDN